MHTFHAITVANNYLISLVQCFYAMTMQLNNDCHYLDCNVNTNNISHGNCVFLMNLSQILCNFKGEFQSATAPKEAPFSPALLPPYYSKSPKMAYVWVTDYLLNTAGLVYQNAGILNETVTPSMVSYLSYNTEWEIFCFRQL